MLVTFFTLFPMLQQLRVYFYFFHLNKQMMSFCLQKKTKIHRGTCNVKWAETAFWTSAFYSVILTVSMVTTLRWNTNNRSHNITHSSQLQTQNTSYNVLCILMFKVVTCWIQSCKVQQKPFWQLIYIKSTTYFDQIKKQVIYGCYFGTPCICMIIFCHQNLLMT